MECQFKNKIEPFLDDELPPSERRSVELHLAQCATCKSMADEIQAIASLVQQTSEIIPVREEWLHCVTSQIADQVVQRPRVNSARYGKLVACLVGIAAMIVVVLSINFYQPSDENTSSVTQATLPSDNVTPPPKAMDGPTVIAGDGFLAARDQQSDDTFEFYWVLPKQTNF